MSESQSSLCFLSPVVQDHGASEGRAIGMRCASWHLCEASPDACMSCFHDRPLALVAVQNEPTRGVLDASAPALLEETADVGELQERQWWSEPPSLNRTTSAAAETLCPLRSARRGASAPCRRHRG